MTRHDIGSAVTNKDDIDAGIIQDAGHGIIITGKHGYLFSCLLHFLKDVCRDSLGFAPDGITHDALLVGTAVSEVKIPVRLIVELSLMASGRPIQALKSDPLLT
jgi:hypothetical protein